MNNVDFKLELNSSILQKKARLNTAIAERKSPAYIKMLSLEIEKEERWLNSLPNLLPEWKRIEEKLNVMFLSDSSLKSVWILIGNDAHAGFINEKALNARDFFINTNN